MMRGRGLRVGELAAKAGVGIDTVRFYERRGVLPKAERLRSGYRSFPPVTVDRLVFAKKLRTLGFGLEEVVALLNLVDRGEMTCGSAEGMLAGILGRLDEQIAALTAMRRELGAVVERCNAGRCTVLTDAARLVGRG